MTTESPGRVARRLAELDELEGVVEKLVAGGEGLLRFEGIPIFVSGVVPGDRVRLRLVERRPDYARAVVREIVAPGPGRRAAPCPHYDRCGGCDLQHLEDDLQGRLKVAAAVETLRRIGGVQAPPVRLIRGRPWQYRLRTQLRTDRAEHGASVGYFERRTHSLVAVESCRVLVPELEAAVLSLQRRLSRPPARLDLASGDGGRVTVAPAIEALPHNPVTRRVGGYDYQFDARTFFQGHVDLLGDLVREVCGSWRGETALDLYAGVGLFSLPLASRYGRVTAVESDRISARYARRNARTARLANLGVEAMSVERYLESRELGCDRVVVDPPRAGLGRPIKRALVRLAPTRISYLSCHPATLARDLRDLASDYSLAELVCFDLFPQTGHLETLAQLVRKGPPDSVSER